MVAHEEPAVVDALLERPLERFTPHTLTDPQRLRAELSDVRERGFALANQEQALGAFSVAAPVFGPDREPVAAVAVTMHSARAETKRLAPTVRTVGMSITRSLAMVHP